VAAGLGLIGPVIWDPPGGRVSARAKTGDRDGVFIRYLVPVFVIAAGDVADAA